MNMSVMGERIKATRLERKLTLEKLAEKIGISRNFLWEIEAGRKAPAIQTLYSIAKELNVSIDYLFSLAPTENTPEETQITIKINNMMNKMSFKELSVVYELLKTYCENK